MTEQELMKMVAPFTAVSKHDGHEVVATGFSQNDPLGVGGGLFPNNPTVHFEKGGWLLVSDFIKNFDLKKESAT
jgi:hypothetical protein